MRTTSGLLYEGADWNFDTLQRTYDAIEEIGTGELGLDLYRNQIEVITAEQMLDAYAGVGMPVMYRHWSFGKRFAQNDTLYRKGLRGLALEIVINSNPSICYVMEENTMTMQATVLAHAAMGHNHFFKSNHAFQSRTDANAILDYIAFTKRYVARCEERYGVKAVERVLDAAHALSDQGVDRFGRRERPRIGKERERAIQRLEEAQADYNDLWRTLPARKARPEVDLDEEAERRSLGLPEENLLYFLEKHAPQLKDWERELLRIVRNMASYFEPQRQTKVMNEGCACWCHYQIMNRLHRQGRIDDSAMLEFLHLHSSVVFQPDFDDRRFSSINPYALGFAMMRDIERICTEPTEEDTAWFPDIAGNGCPVETLRRAWTDFRDESFIRQYLSPRVIRDFHLFKIDDDGESPELRVAAIHDESGYKRIRRSLATAYDPATDLPRIEIVDADMQGGRTLVLQHTVRDGQVLDALETRRVLRHIAALWGYPVVLCEVDADGDRVFAEHKLDSEALMA
ncbi:SpoVR family protein [Ferruginivarius sediminum]|uniref:SpoVR family protein n=1 Tax=Ferruginivarius sediminum TaxID=2661937 RepID=A0A369TH64_9PROT|nr:SpoVR family protein [Ferruginivarius sediminum]RDD63715.1 SpoVR family protein [Ferruginivarius sediminum]